MRIANREDWESVRAGGRRRFLLLAGVVGRGLPLGLFVAVVVQIASGRPFPESLVSLRFAVTMLGAVAVFSLSGCFSAAMHWRLAERRFDGEGPS